MNFSPATHPQRKLIRQPAQTNLLAPVEAQHVCLAASPFSVKMSTIEVKSTRPAGPCNRPRLMRQGAFSLKRAGKIPHRQRLALMNKLDRAALRTSHFAVKIDQRQLRRSILRATLESETDEAFWSSAEESGSECYYSESETPNPQLLRELAKEMALQMACDDDYEAGIHFTVSGHDGDHKDYVNGVYQDDGKDDEGRMLFRHTKHADVWMYADHEGKWRIGHTLDKDSALAGDCGYARSGMCRMGEPWASKSWEENLDSTKRWAASKFTVVKLEEVLFVQSAHAGRSLAYERATPTDVVVGFV